MNTRRRRIGVLVAWLALLVPTAWAGGLKTGEPAPAATLVTLDGQTISTEALRGQVVVLTFWASWCEHCRDELPLLSRYAQEHRAQGLRVLAFGIDDDDSESLAKARAVANTLSFPVGLLARSQAVGYGRMWRVPTSFVIDRDGRLRYNGWQAKDPVWNTASLDQVVGPLLAK